MLYKDFQGMKLSALGFGCMRLPVVDGNDTAVDKAAAAELVEYAMKNGVNYYDTAWGYHGGTSEGVMGEILSKYPRESFYLASKFPGYDRRNLPKVEEIFEKQLERCQVDYFDFYLLHNVWEMNVDAYLDDSTYGVVSYLKKQKETGRIRHLGFSAHGSVEVMRRFLEAYGADMEFCQIQLNYLDWSFQDAKGKVELLREYQLPVWVMEPLRGGRLAELAPEDAAKLKELRPDEDIPAWAFRFLQGIEGVTMVLSGMTTFQALQNNIRTFEADRPLSAQELEVLMGIAGSMIRRTAQPCTACRYSTNHCPMHLDIPYLLKLYNEHVVSEGSGFIAPMSLLSVPDEKKPSACLGCRSCEAVCPQGIKISEVLADFVDKLKK